MLVISKPCTLFINHTHYLYIFTYHAHYLYIMLIIYISCLLYILYHACYLYIMHIIYHEKEIILTQTAPHRYDPLLFVRAFNLQMKTETTVTAACAFRCRSSLSVCWAVGHPGLFGKWCFCSCYHRNSCHRSTNLIRVTSVCAK